MAAFIQKIVRAGTNYMDKPSGPDQGFSTAAKERDLFPQVDPAVDGEDCLHDCDSCTIRYPAKFKINEDVHLYGWIKGWATHMLVATGKSDWTRNCEDEKGSVMQAIDKSDAKTNGRMMLSASNIPVPHDDADPYKQPTRVLLLPAFSWVENVSPSNVAQLITHVVNAAPTTTTPVGQPAAPPDAAELPFATRPCPHAALILLCSQKTRDARCGQSAPLLRREFERHLRPLGLYRDLHDERPGGVGIYFISHTGGHKFSANVIVYRRRNMGRRVPTAGGDSLMVEDGEPPAANGEDADADGAVQGIWLARVRPDECEGIVKYTVLQGKLVKPDSQLRGGFDRERRLTSW